MLTQPTWPQPHPLLLREADTDGARSYFFFCERWLRLGCLRGLSLRWGLDSAYVVSQTRYSAGPHVGAWGGCWDGFIGLKRLMIDALALRSRVGITYRLAGRHLRKNMRGGDRYSARLLYAPPRVR